MFDSIEASNPDAILALMAQFRGDERPDKLDLGVGVYKDSSGQTPVMQAVKEAETRLHAAQDTKTYVGPTGDAQFCQSMRDLVLGVGHDGSRVRSLQTPGGSGALKVLADLLHWVSPGATTWLSTPTWPNHVPLLTQAGHNLQNYRYYNSAANTVDFTAMLDDLKQAKSGDIVLLHGCCHNPTGADLSAEQWHEVAQLCSTQGVFPFVDLAYQGFADGLEEDATGVRILFEHMDEMAVASSCSKNLALYRERVGAALLVGRDSDAADRAFSRLSSMVRANYSMPPDHGAAVTRDILQQSDLTALWKEELNAMRTRMQRLRQEFADELRKRSNSDRFDYIANQKGMFSRLPLTTEQIDTLRNDHAIYIVGDGRVNIAGLPDSGLDQLASTIMEVIQSTS